MSREWDEGWRAVLCGGGLCDADQNWRGPFLGCRGGGWAGSVSGPNSGVCFGACAGGWLCHHAVNCLVDCVRARACTNKAWQTGARRSWWWKVVQQVVHASDRRSSRLRWSAAAVSAAVEEEQSLVVLKGSRTDGGSSGRGGGQADVQRVHGRMLVSEMRSPLP